MLAELADVVIRDKFAIKNSQVDRFLSILLKKSKIVSDTPHFKAVSEDPDDDKVLDTAYNGKADYIVTGDRHLLALKRFKRTQILTVTQMLVILS
jgi:putative PIN family toxin of toxin-antitoxin system